MAPADDPTTSRMTAFLAEIGLPVRWADVAATTAPLPGLTIEAGSLVADPDRLAHPGDLLHEAGHLAVLLPAERVGINGTAGSDGGMEMGAIAWSYAAVCHLGLDPAVVFHADGYLGASASHIENFSTGHYFGVPILQWRGLAARDDQPSLPHYPAMLKWVCDQPA